jgi:hypothetical protein
MQAPNTPKSKITALFALMMASIIFYFLKKIGVDILEINDHFYQSLTLCIMIFFSNFFWK